MNDLNLVFPEIFLSIFIMFLLLLGVFKKNSSNFVYNLSIVSLIIILFLNFNNYNASSIYLFSNSYKIDYLSIFMKFLTISSGIFVSATAVSLKAGWLTSIR